MEEQGKNIDELFKSRLGGYTEQPPDAVWQSLEQHLDGSKIKKAFPWYWGVLGVLCIVLLSYMVGSKLWYSPKQVLHTATTALPTQQTTTDTRSYTQPKTVSTKSVQHFSESDEQKITRIAAEKTTNTNLQSTSISTIANVSIKQLKPLNSNSILQMIPNRSITNNTIQIQPPTISLPLDDEFVIAKQNIIGLNAAAYNKTQPVKPVDHIDALYAAEIPTIPVIVMPKDELLIKLKKTKVIALKSLPQRRLDVSAATNTYLNNITAPIPPLSSLQQHEGMATAENEPIAATKPQPGYPSILQTIAETESITLQPEKPLQSAKITNLSTVPTTEAIVPALVHVDTGKRRIVRSWDYGLKTGYETGLRNYAANKGTIGAYLQANLNNKLSIVVQPALKIGWQQHTNHAGHTSYYDVSKNSTTALHIITPDGIDGGGNPVYNIIRRYFYEQMYDSVVVTSSIQPRSYIEMELPLMTQYRVYKGLHVYAGASANFGKLLQAERKLTRYKNLVRRDTAVFAEVNESIPAPPVPGIETRIKHNNKSFDEYNENEPINAANNPIRVHYIFGANYLLKNSLSFDVMIQGMLNDATYIPDERIREIYKKPYVRIGLGYRINAKK